MLYISIDEIDFLRTRAEIRGVDGYLSIGLSLTQGSPGAR